MSVIDNKKKEKRALTKDIDFLSIVTDDKPYVWDNEKEEVKQLERFCRTCRKMTEKTISIRKWKKMIVACPTCKDSLVRGFNGSLSNYYKL